MSKMCDFCDDEVPEWISPEAQAKARQVADGMMNLLLIKLALLHLEPLDNRRG